MRLSFHFFQAPAEKAPKKSKNKKKKEKATSEVSNEPVVQTSKDTGTQQEAATSVEEEIIEAIEDVAEVQALPEAEQDVMQNLTDAMAAIEEPPVVKEAKQTEAAPSQKKNKNKKAKSAVAGMI